MKHEKLTFRSGFRVGPGNAKSQCAAMVIPPGGSEGGPENRHRGADQWLFVVEGKGVATVNNRKIELEVGTMLLIEAGDVHEIRNTGRRLLKTVNVYVPPAYHSSADELPAGKA